MSDDEFDLPDSETDNVSVGSNRRIILLDEEKLPTEKKVKLHQFKRKYVKTSWVWKYFETDQNGKYNVCQVLIMNLRNDFLFLIEESMYSKIIKVKNEVYD